MSDTMMFVPVDMIYPNPLNPRKYFDPAAMAEMAASVKQIGVIQPVVVVRDEGENTARFRLVAGERRWRAAQMAELKDIPAMVRELTPEQELEVAIIENLQREDVSPIEEANGFQMMLESGMKQEALAEKLGCSQSHIANRLRLLDLPEEIQQNISRGIITASHAKELLTARKINPEIMAQVAKRIVEEGLSVRDTANNIQWDLWTYSKPLHETLSYTYPQLQFNPDNCDKCKKKVMLKVPKGYDYVKTEEALRCLNEDCWENKNKDAIAEKERKRLQNLEQEKEKLGVHLEREETWAEKRERLEWENSKPLYGDNVIFDQMIECRGCGDKKVLVNPSGKKELRCTDMECWKTQQKEAKERRCYVGQSGPEEPVKQNTQESFEKINEAAATEASAVYQEVAAVTENIGHQQAAVIPAASSDPAITKLIEQARQVWEDEAIRTTWGEPEIAMDRESILSLGELIGHWKHKCEVCIGATTIPEQLEGSTVIIREQGLKFNVSGNFNIENGELTVGNDNSYVKDVKPELPVYYHIRGTYGGAKDIRQLVGIVTPTRTIFVNSYVNATMRKDVYEKWIKLVNELPPVEQTDLGPDDTLDIELSQDFEQLDRDWTDSLMGCGNCGEFAKGLCSGGQRDCVDNNFINWIEIDSDQVPETTVTESDAAITKTEDPITNNQDQWSAIRNTVSTHVNCPDGCKYKVLIKRPNMTSKRCVNLEFADIAFNPDVLREFNQDVNDKWQACRGVFEAVEAEADPAPEPEVTKLNSYQKIMRQYVCNLCSEYGGYNQTCYKQNLENPCENGHCLDKQELKFKDKKGRVIFVSSGLWKENGQDMYGTFWQSDSGGLHRVKSPAMPMVSSKDEAEHNLILYARDKIFSFVVEKEDVDQADAV